MNLLSAMTRVAAQDPSGISLDSARCLHSRDKFSTCDACVRLCPAGAIQMAGESLSMASDRCVRCGLCLWICPAGAFSGDDGTAGLLECVAHLPSETTEVQITCQAHPAPENAPADTHAVIRVRTCLAALGASAYLSLFALGVRRATVRLDACRQCPIGAVHPEIGRAIATAGSMLPAGSGAGGVTIADGSPGEGWTVRPVYEMGNPLRSRRDLFRMAASSGRQLAARALAGDEVRPSGEKAPPRERRRLLVALSHLWRAEASLPESPLVGFSCTGLAADETCTACGACARVCPTGALRLALMVNSGYELTFATGACTDCGICLDVCQPGALHRTRPPALGELLDPRPVVLRSGSLQQCAKCGVKFAGETASGLCPLCEYRQQNPFGSRWHFGPPGGDA